jgi:glycosyltransferase involved in cell wall biosynthesis
MNPPALSIIIPAYNESARIGRTIAAARRALEEAGFSDYELIVSDDASTDDTSRIAQESGAKVVLSGKRNIGATRNVGAAAASGNYLLFLDADTTVNAATLKALAKAMDAGVVGGGACVSWSSPAVWWLSVLVRVWNLYARLSKSPAGSFFFVRREAFEQVGGFDEEYFVSEELFLAQKLKRLGKLVILTEPVATSPRKAYEFTIREHLGLFWRAIRAPRTFNRNPEGLEIWYTRRG